jgi:hypothetical protein
MLAGDSEHDENRDENEVLHIAWHLFSRPFGTGAKE